MSWLDDLRFGLLVVRARRARRAMCLGSKLRFDREFMASVPEPFRTPADDFYAATRLDFERATLAARRPSWATQ